MNYGGKELSDYSLWELGDIEKSLKAALDKREAASKHVKFNENREINGKNVAKMEFPPINPEFLKLKEAVEIEIRKKQNVS